MRRDIYFKCATLLYQEFHVSHAERKSPAFQENIITQNQTDCSTNFPAPKSTGICRKMQKLSSAGRGVKNVKGTCVSPKLTATDHSPVSFRAPLEGESQQAYRVFLEQQLIGYLANLVKEAARLL